MSKQIDFFPKTIYNFILIEYTGHNLSLQNSDLQICVNILKVMKTLKTPFDINERGRNVGSI